MRKTAFDSSQCGLHDRVNFEITFDQKNLEIFEGENVLEVGESRPDIETTRGSLNRSFHSVTRFGR